MISHAETTSKGFERRAGRARLTTATVVGVMLGALVGFYYGSARATGTEPDGRDAQFRYVPPPPNPARVDLPRDWRWSEPGVKVDHMYRSRRD